MSNNDQSKPIATKVNFLILLSVLTLASTGIFVYLWLKEKDKVSYLTEKTQPQWRIKNTEFIERYMADDWTEYYKNDVRMDGLTYSVSFDIVKLKDVIDAWTIKGQIGGKAIDQVNAEFLIYGDNILSIPTGDPKKVPGAFSICLSPYNKKAKMNLYDNADPKTRPLNLGDLHP